MRRSTQETTLQADSATCYNRMKLSWRWPRHHRVVFIGRTGNSLLRTYISETDVDIYEGLRGSTNVWVLLRALTYGPPSARRYYRAYLRYVQPRFVITFEDNALEFYLTRQFWRSCTTLAIQNGRRDSFSNLPNRNLWNEIRKIMSPEFAPSAIAVHGEPAANYYRLAIPSHATRIVSTGNIRNNAIPRQSEHRTGNRPRLMFVSSFPNLGRDGSMDDHRDRIFGYWQGEPITFGDLFKVEAIAARLCADIARSRELDFVILGKRPSWQRAEFRYFEEALREYTWSYSAAEYDATSYTATTHDDVVVSVDSTLGYELFARGHRIAFVGARMRVAGFSHIRDGEFGYPYITDAVGPYWTNQCTREEVDRVVSFALDTSIETWLQLTEETRRKVMPFDPGNAILCGLLDDLGIATHGPRFLEPATATRK